MKPIMLPDFGSGGSTPAANHDYGKVLGAPFAVYLKNGVTREVDPATGKTMVRIIDLPGLVAAVVRSRVLHPRKLAAQDLKFLRSAIGVKSKNLASVVELTPEFYSRCETGQKVMSGSTEKMFRSCVFLLSYLKDKDVRDVRDAIREKAAAEKKLSPDEAQKALAAIKKLLFDMKISPVFEVGELSFTLARRCVEGTPCGDDDGTWDNELKAA